MNLKNKDPHDEAFTLKHITEECSVNEDLGDKQNSKSSKFTVSVLPGLIFVCGVKLSILIDEPVKLLRHQEVRNDNNSEEYSLSTSLG